MLLFNSSVTVSEGWRPYFLWKCCDLWLITNELRMNSNNHRVNLCLDTYFHCVFCPKHIFNTARKPNFRGQKRQIVVQMTNFSFSVPYILICQSNAKVCRFVIQNIFEIFVKWHHHSAKSLSCIEYGRNFIVLSKNYEAFICTKSIYYYLIRQKCHFFSWKW